MPSELTLRRPREDEEEEFLRAHRATSPEVPSFLHYYTEGMPFRRYLEVLAEHEQGVNLPSAHVPSTFLFAFVGPDRRAYVDSALAQRFSRARGRPHRLCRGAGVSTAGPCHHDSSFVPADRARAKCRGTHRILVTCDDDNLGSIRAIERNNGVLENIVSGPDLDKPKRRYWIDLDLG